MVLLSTALLFTGYALLLSVVPLWVVRQGAGEFAAGAATGVFMGATVAAQTVVPALAARFGYRLVTAAGGLLLGLPAPLLVLTTDWPGVLAVSLVRGLGFGLVSVCGSALIGELLPASSAARGSGWYGLATGLPQLLGLAAGTWAAGTWGFTEVFLVATALPLAGVLPLLSLPKLLPGDSGPAVRWRAVTTRTWRPGLVMFSGAVGLGAMATFVPLVLNGPPAAVSATLFVVTGAALLGRWSAGLFAHRVSGSGGMLGVATVVLGLGMAVFAVTAPIGGPLALTAAIAGGAVFGAGFGVVQNDALVVMFARVPPGAAGVVWNLAFDAGQGAGAVLVGALLAGLGPSGGFGVLAGFALVLLPVARAARVTG
ncbi:MFS transporter [Amycolatopsis sp. 195334CR]|nr:MFS transporter [Amycolatopsis sp. 195334CR]